jgi:hypothetical protein
LSNKPGHGILALDMKKYIIVAVSILSLFAVSCAQTGPYRTGDRTRDRYVARLIRELDENASWEERFVQVEQIRANLAHRPEVMNAFLTTYVQRYPDDPRNAYYLMAVAEYYRKVDALDFAILYYERIVRNYDDVLVKGESIHYLCLRNLVESVEVPQHRLEYYRELVARFSGKIDLGLAYYNLAKTYETLGEWDQALQAYRTFLNSPRVAVPGQPNAHQEVAELIAFHESRDKEWLYDDLSTLVSDVQTALRYKDLGWLRRLQAKVNFFAVSWEEEWQPVNPEFLANLDDYLSRQPVAADRTIDPDSNEREAYLRTYNWHWRLSEWYFYFRKVYYPLDPEKHGKWEWVGIYLGEKPFVGRQGS